MVFFIDGVKEDVQIVLDNVRIVSSQFDVPVAASADAYEDTDVTEGDAQQDENCIKNGDFESRNSRNCKIICHMCIDWCYLTLFAFISKGNA